MADDFHKSVQLGLKLSKRIYYGKEPSMKPPQPPSSMEKSSSEDQLLLPTSPMVYAVVSNPSMIDNPDIKSYQPYVHGRCKPPALIPLHMYGVEVEVDCYLDMAFVNLSGTWRLHCVDAAQKCDCLLAIPMGEQGSVLGFEIDASGGSYLSQLVKVEDAADLDGSDKIEYGGFLKPNIFTLKIPKVEGGSKILVKAKWSQRLMYENGWFLLKLPFSFPVYVTPGGKISKKQKVLLNVNSGTNAEVQCKAATHPLKELKRQVGKFGFLYEEEIDTWSQTDFEFSYSVFFSDIHGGFLLHSPSSNDIDQREMFAFYLFPGETQNRKVFKKRVIFLVDISGSMKGAPIENVKKEVLAFLSNLNQDDLFNIIAFNGDSHSFSSSMELATHEALQRVSEWISIKLIPEGDTNLLLPMKQALEMVSHDSSSMAHIFLITDGAVENERDICNVVQDYCITKEKLPFLRISTFGIGSYCNHYFLQTLAQKAKGHYDAAYDAGSIAPRLQRLCTVSSQVILSNIEVDGLSHVQSLTLYPSMIQDLSYGCPIIISGRYEGKLPESLMVRGTLADMSNFVTDLKIWKEKDIPLDKVFAKAHVDALTAKAWFMESKEVERQVAEISMQTGVLSEYTRMILFQTDVWNQGPDAITIQGKEAYEKSSLQKMINSQKIILLQSMGVGFGDLEKTAQNFPPGVVVKAPDTTEFLVNAATGYCGKLLDRFCCMCFIQTLSTVNDRCIIIFSQVCAALACCQCIDCCFDLCDNCC
ncbi:uncharacterized protein LOC110684405 [Chenopodium quinoa]|uniref:uncharacterized protein LOC110684405 n=1 Tax=Chenopodium quinoa TaxID=63459 RepID=UPI000B774C02|nr:uncharacterized protein LOC110684405 [Chenopodium quinoa]